jgi:ABC-2 type transport system permease protein
MGSVYALTLRQLSGRWRLIIMTVLAAMPVFIATMMLRSDNAPSVWDFEQAVLGAMLAGAIAPLVVLAIGAAAFSNEVDDRTLANLTLAPIPRWKIVLPKLLAAITIAAPFIAASAFLTSWVAFLGDTRAVFAVTFSAIVGVALYSSAFVYLGLMTTQAIGIGLVYIVLWEGFFSQFVAGVRLLSIRHYTISLMYGLDPRRFAPLDDQLSLWVVVTLCVVVFGGFLLLSVRRLRRMDVP